MEWAAVFCVMSWESGEKQGRATVVADKSEKSSKSVDGARVMNGQTIVGERVRSRSPALEPEPEPDATTSPPGA